MTTFLILLLISVAMILIFDQEEIATIVGIGIGVALIYYLFVYFTEIMILFVCVIGLIGIATGITSTVKKVGKVINPTNDE